MDIQREEIAEAALNNHNQKHYQSSQIKATSPYGNLHETKQKSLPEQRHLPKVASILAQYRKLLGEYYSCWKEAQSVPYTKLFKYADAYDVGLMIVGFLAAVVNGLSMPAILLIQSHLINSFGSVQNDPILMAKKVSQESLYLVYTALVTWLASYWEVSCWMQTGERQVSRIRAKYLRAVLRQNVGFFDCESSAAEVINSISADTQLLQEAMSEKVGNFIKNISHFIGGYMVAFVQLWKMAIILLLFTPLLLLPGILYSIILSDFTLKMQVAYVRAGIVSQQAISSIRTVHSLVAERKTVKSFSESLEGVVKLGEKQGIAKGLAMGSNGIIFALWALLGWYGGELVTRGKANGGQILTSGFAILTGGLALGSATPHVKTFLEGCIAAYKIFEMINRVPPIDYYNMTGKTLEVVEGKIEFRKVNFVYPSRVAMPILKDFSLEILPGKTVALVGSSGSGKSTLISLIVRYYDPLSGQIQLDGIDLKELQLKWLRQQIGLVSQEPALFTASIKENILYGKEKGSMDEVITAANLAGAHAFIMKLPGGYETHVGERGVQISGGQKQRIAIARAMLRNPRILLLDEATSALDPEAEKEVQQAMDNVVVGRTTVVVAHRLSTIYSADLIVVMQNGIVVELGRHEDLLTRGENGVYAGFVHLQHSHLESSKSGDRSLHIKEKTHTESIVTESSVHFNVDEINDGLSQCNKERQQKTNSSSSFSSLVALNSPEWKECVLGLIGAIGFGIVQPFYAYTIGRMVSSYYLQDYHKLREHMKIYSSIFLCLTVASFVFNHLQHYNFSVMGEHLTLRIRKNMLSKILSFEVAWFDEDENSTATICARLACDANKVRSVLGDRISLVAQTASAVLASTIIGLTNAWRLALVMTASQPLIIYCYHYIKKSAIIYAQKEAEIQKESCDVASEAVALQRTVTAFSAQEAILSHFEATQKRSRKETNRSSFVSGMCIGAAQFVLFSSWGLDLWYGAQLVKNGQATFRDVFGTFFVLASTGRVLADAGTLNPDIGRSSTAVEYVLNILHRTTKINSDKQDDWKPDTIDGNIHIIGVDFAYPLRPDIYVLRDFSLTVHCGSIVALVGQSGSGKSTIIGLIERFYDPSKGKVLIDGKDIKTIHLQTLRQHVGLVNQEPTLFATTIRENIAYGRNDCSEEEIVAAAHAANAHGFISALPHGYSTYAGELGCQLSGGQKQRIAIARAIIKNPQILLLDEATSALDAEAERVVQTTLEQMMIGRTTIIVAHRMSTIMHAHRIAVIENGRIVEEGSHQELLADGQKDGGAYYKLISLQHHR